MAKHWWLCQRCGNRLERTKQKCVCGKKRPPARVPKHAQTLRDDSYETYNKANREIHGVSDESCGCCGKPRSQERRHDRDHGHLKGSLTYGKPRGLACVYCNKHMPVGMTAELAHLIAAYLDRADSYYAGAA